MKCTVCGISEINFDLVTMMLDPANILGTILWEPFSNHTIAALCWWLLCWGIKAPTYWKKLQLIVRNLNISAVYFCSHFWSRVNQAHLENTALMDANGSYIYKKYRILTEAGGKFSSHYNPAHHCQGGELLIIITLTLLDPHIPTVTSGKLFNIELIVHSVVRSYSFGVHLFSWSHWIFRWARCI